MDEKELESAMSEPSKEAMEAVTKWRESLSGRDYGAIILEEGKLNELIAALLDSFARKARREEAKLAREEFSEHFYGDFAVKITLATGSSNDPVGLRECLDTRIAQLEKEKG